MADEVMAEVLSFQKPDVWFFPGQLPERPDGQDGLCDANAGTQKQAAEPLRYATAQLSLTRTADMLILAAATSFTLLDKGEGQDMPNATNVDLSGAETDLNKDGGMAKGTENVWVIQSLGTQILEPYALTGDPSDKVYYKALMDMASRVARAMLDNLYLEAEYEDEDCPRLLGLASFWPKHAATIGEGVAGHSASIGPANVLPLRRPFMSGSAKGDYSITLKIKSNQEVRIQEDPAFPLPVAVESVIVPLQVLLYGRPGCNTRCMPVCVRPDGTMYTRQLGT